MLFQGRRSLGNPDVICGSASPGARFGSAIGLLGDINGDGFKDVGVGAPYEKPDGALYIYHGRRNFGSGRELPGFSQRIRPSIFGIPLSIKGFGISIAGDMDVDGNETPGDRLA